MIRTGLIVLFAFLQLEMACAFQQYLYKSADTLSARSWTLEDGLPVNTTGRIVQDSTGYLWITTYDGLVRFDGLNFEVFNYSNTPEMPHNRSTILYNQKGVGLWVGLEYGGVLLIQDGKFHHYGSENGFTDSDLTQLYESPDGDLYFITHSGLFLYKEGRFTKPKLSEDEQQNQVSNILFDEDGSLWLATNHGILHYNTDEDVEEYLIQDPSHNNQILSLFLNDEGHIIAGTSDGIYEFRAGKFMTKPSFKVADNTAIFEIYRDQEHTLLLGREAVFEYQDGQVRRIKDSRLKQDEIYIFSYRDSEGTIWLIGTDGTLSTFKNGQIESLGLEKVSDYHFNSMFEDREGTLWFATNLNGLVAINKSKVRNIGAKEGLSTNNILSLHQDEQKRLYIGTRGGGLNILSGNTIKHYGMQDGIAANTVHTIAEDSSGTIWIGYLREGIDRFSPGGMKNYKFGNNYETNTVRSIYTASDGTLWAGTYGGLIQFDPENENHKIYTHKDGLSGTKIRYITEDDDGAIWTGSLDGGVSRFHNGAFQNFTIEEGLSSNNIRSIYIDEQEPETIWIGSENNGLNRLRNGEIKWVNTEDGLPDHIIHWISQDKNGWLWMSSNRGVFKINKKELNDYLDGISQNFTLLRYGSAEGMRNPEANGAVQEAGLRTPNGYFMFATQEGVAIFNANREKENTIPPTIIIQEVRAGGESFQPDKVELPSGYSTFEIDFHALTFVAPEKTRYRYRLVNYDDHWNDISGDRTITYANIPAGKYTFEVLAANNDGIWTESPARATITIPPLFYEQVWFYLALLIVVGGLYYGVSQLRYNYLLKRQKKLTDIIETQTAQIRKEKNEIQEFSEIIKKQAEQLRESNITKDKFFSLIAHDLRNPFQALLGLTELTLMDVDEKENPALKENLDHVYASAKSLHSFVEDLLKWASLQNGKMKPSPELINLNDLSERIIQLFEHVAEQKQIEIILEDRDEVNVFADLNMLETILRNLVSNALKFTPHGGEIKLTVQENTANNTCTIKVKDTGIGMPPEMVNNLLQIDTNSSRTGTNNEKGTGLGLFICKEMIALHNGLLEVKSKQNRGTTFTITLPKKGI